MQATTANTATSTTASAARKAPRKGTPSRASYRHRWDMARRLAQAAADIINGTQAEPWHDAPALLVLVQEVAEGVGPGRAVLMHHLTDDECRARRVPVGATEPAIYVASMQGAPLAEFDAWDDGDCLHIRAHGMWAEVHHGPRPVAGA